MLRAWSDGDQDALQALTPIVYEDLPVSPAHYMRRERSGHSLQATALVNEAYKASRTTRRMQWQDRAHFFAVSAQVMPAPGRRMRWSRRSRNWKSSSSPWARAWDDHEVVGP